MECAALIGRLQSRGTLSSCPNACANGRSRSRCERAGGSRTLNLLIRKSGRAERDAGQRFRRSASSAVRRVITCLQEMDVDAFG